MTQDNTLGAAWMREQAAQVCEDAAPFTEAAIRAAPISALFGNIVSIEGSRTCRKNAEAIRAIPLPTNADLLAGAMKLPEVVTLVEAMGHASNILEWCAREGRMATTGLELQVQGWVAEGRTALAPFTAAKETP